MSSTRRRRSALVMVLALAPALLACAEVERTVTLHTVEQDERGGGVRIVGWESNRYPDHVARTVDNGCWASAVGEPVPEACLTASVLANETEPFGQAPLIAGAGTIFTFGVLLFLAWKQVAWQPVVERTTEGTPPPRHFDEAGAVALMRGTEIERSARIEAEKQRRDPGHPFLAGVVLALLALGVLAMLVGWGRTFGWGLVTGMLLFVAVGPVAALTALGLLHPANLDASISRLKFLGGATTVLLIGGFIALNVRAALLNLNGIG